MIGLDEGWMVHALFTPDQSGLDGSWFSKYQSAELLAQSLDCFVAAFLAA
jgi:hypothetical protein